MGSTLFWQALLPYLSKEASLLAFDLPGFGQSETLPGGLPLGALAEVADKILQHFDWKIGVTLVGHSHGGGVAQSLAVRRGKFIKELILLGSIGAPTHLFYRFLPLPYLDHFLGTSGGLFRRLCKGEFLKPLVRKVLEKSIFYPDEVSEEYLHRKIKEAHVRPEVLKSVVRLSHGNPCETLMRQAHQIKAPLLMVHGGQDRAVPIQYGKDIFELFAEQSTSNRFEEIKEAGHMFPLTQPKLLMPILKKWWKTLERY